MPLIKSRSDKAFSKNVAAEMNAGKPPKQSLAIAYSIKRKGKKARGGEITAPQESRTNVDKAKDSREMHMMYEGGMLTADSAADPYALEMARKRKMMAQGGTITANEDKMVTEDDQQMPRERYSEHSQDLVAGDEKHYTEDDYDDARSKEVLRGKSAPMHKSDINMLEDKMVSEDDMHDDRDMEVMRSKSEGHAHEPTANEDGMPKADDSDSRALMMIRRRMAEGGKVSVSDAIRQRYADGGEVDLRANAEESPNMEDRYNYELLRDKNYPAESEESALEDLDYDTSKSIGDDLEDEDMRGKGILSGLRKKMRMK